MNHNWLRNKLALMIKIETGLELDKGLTLITRATTSQKHKFQWLISVGSASGMVLK